MKKTNKELYLQALINLENDLAEGLITEVEFSKLLESLKLIYNIKG